MLWPLSPPTALVLLATVVPSYCYLNRGFTQWFHLAGIYYALTQWQFLERFQVLSGCSICLGWYASLIYEFMQHGRFCHPLYKNMPTSLMQYYLVEVDDDNGSNHPQDQHSLDFESRTALLALAAAHVLDLLAHPLLTYYFWRKHLAKGGTIKQIVSWPVIVAAYLYSRLWSLTHTKYNTGEFGLWYFGFDIYVMDSLDSWYPAYIAESCVYGSLLLWKLHDEVKSLRIYKGSKTVSEKKNADKDPYDVKPQLLLSESSVSIDSNR
jgi:hypothetical protein